jgi:hypothetical protein
MSAQLSDEVKDLDDGEEEIIKTYEVVFAKRGDVPLDSFDAAVPDKKALTQLPKLTGGDGGSGLSRKGGSGAWSMH